MMFPFVLHIFACKIKSMGMRFHCVYNCRFLSTGASYAALADSFRLGISAVHYIIKEVCEAIWKTTAPLHMPVPTTEMLLATSNEFYLMWNFPNCVGSIDGKHIRLKCPSNAGTMYYNYKRYYSIVLQGLADARYRFIAVEIGAYGKQSGGGIFRHSSLYQLLSSNNFNIPNARKLPLSDVELPFVILGDEAYPLLSYLMRPYPRRQLTESRRLFNYRLSRGRRAVESAFGILAGKWRILNKPIETSNIADRIVRCKCVLHNTVIDREGVDEASLLELQNHEDSFSTSLDEPERQVTRSNNRSNLRARRVRDAFTVYFNSDVGRLPENSH